VGPIAMGACDVRVLGRDGDRLTSDKEDYVK